MGTILSPLLQSFQARLNGHAIAPVTMKQLKGKIFIPILAGRQQGIAADFASARNCPSLMQDAGLGLD
jgi:hypothetical protein